MSPDMKANQSVATNADSAIGVEAAYSKQLLTRFFPDRLLNRWAPTRNRIGSRRTLSKAWRVALQISASDPKRT